MKTPTRTITAAIKLGICLVLGLGFVAQIQAQEKKLDGTWAWTMPARGGGTERKMTLKLKTEGDKVTGKLAAPGRDGTLNETEIQEGKVKGDEVTFNVVREVGGNKMVSKYIGKLSGDTIKGKTSFERGGETMTRDWEAKRQPEKK